MKINIVAFGIAKDILEASQIQIDVDDNIKALALKQLLLAKYPSFQQLNSFQLAVNQEYAGDETILKENDEIVLIPPVSGG